MSEVSFDNKKSRQTANNRQGDRVITLAIHYYLLLLYFISYYETFSQ